MLRDAFRAVHENVGALLLFLMVDMPLTFVVAAGNEFYLEPRREAMDERVLGLVQIGIDVLQVFVYAAIVSIVFSRLARNIDRPLWKVHGDGDALARFFPMWLLLTFICVAFLRFGQTFFESGQEDFGGVLQVIGMLLITMVIPFGAIVTFLGNGRGEDLRVAVSILPRVIDRFLLAMLIGFFQFNLMAELYTSEGTEYWMRPLIAALDVYMDCVVFSYIFLACREQRDLEEPIDPYDL